MISAKHLRKLSVFFATSLSLTPAFAENEATYDPQTGIIHIPKLLVIGDKSKQKYAVNLHDTGNMTFQLTDVTKTDAIIDSEVEKYINITTGLYGQAVFFDDVIYNDIADVHYISNFIINIYPITNTPQTASKIKSIYSNNNGFYQFDLPAGNYTICTNTYNCQNITIKTNELLRCDYAASLMSGWACKN